MIKINGKENPNALGQILSDYLENSGYVAVRVAVEINNAILPRENYDNYIIADGDEIEIVSFMGGG